jgi:hypothetical protein
MPVYYPMHYDTATGTWLASAGGWTSMGSRARTINIVTPGEEPVAAIAWAIPSALTELFGVALHRTKVDLTQHYQARLVVNVGANATANAPIMKPQYSTDQSTWNDLANVASALNLNMLAAGGSANSVRTTAWEPIVAAARADVFIRIVGSGGPGTSLTLGSIALQVR